MRCPQCNQQTDTDGFCNHCETAANARIDTGPLLTRANLLRMRGYWEDAADQCIEVLRLSPGNPTAHSLLGDIYQDQGKPEEARHWYHLALELNPHSTGDRAKLARSEEAIEARTHKAEWEAVIEGRSEPIGTKLLVRESVQRIVAVAGTTVCAVILVAAILVSLGERRPDLTDELPVIPLFTANRRAKLEFTTPREKLLMKRLTDKPLGGAAQPASISLDPRTQSADLRILVPARLLEGSAVEKTREAVMREGYRGAFHLYDADSTLTAIQVTVVGPVTFAGGQRDTDMLVVGTLSPRNLVVSPDVVTYGELLQFFHEPLWGTTLAH